MTARERSFEFMPWSFSFLLAREDDFHASAARFDARIYEPASVQAFIDGYLRLVTDACTAPDRPVGQLLEVAG
jgi:hypothetical protein